MSRIGIDLDGVAYDFAASLKAYLESLGGLRDYPEPKRWEFYEDWGFDLHGFLRLCHDGVDAGIIFTHGDPYPNTREAFDRIKAAGHTIHIVTDRSFGTNGASEAATRAWLDRHELPFDSLTFTSDKTIVKLDRMVDDKPQNVEDLSCAGVETYMLTRSWNRDYPYTARVLDLLHYAEVVA